MGKTRMGGSVHGGVVGGGGGGTCSTQVTHSVRETRLLARRPA